MNRKLVQTSNFETDDEEDVMDIMHTVRIKVGGKIIPVNVFSAHMDNISFQSQTSIIVTECNFEDIKEYKMVYDRGKCEVFTFYY